jgi:hypothetical protein
MQWSGLTYGNGKFVAIAAERYYMSSSDGLSWSSTTFGPLVGEMKQIAFGQGKFVIVGSHGSKATFATSTDASSWVITQTNDVNWFESVAYSPTLDKFVMIGSSGQAVLYNGTTYSTTYPGGNFKDIAWGNNIFLAVTQAGNGVYTSSNGTAWNSFSSLGMNATSVTFGNGLFVATGINVAGTTYYIKTSTDGTTWSTVYSGNYGFSDVTYDNGRYVAVGYDSSGHKSAIYSTDGANWTAVPTANDTWWSAVAFGNNSYVAVPKSGTPVNYKVLQSSDAVDWGYKYTQDYANGVSGLTYRSLVFASNRFVAPGDSYVMTYDVTNPGWNIYSTVADSWNDIAYGNNTFVAVGESGLIIKSTDAKTWSQSAARGNIHRAITFGKGYFVEGFGNASATYVATSTDGVTWANTTIAGLTNPPTSLAFGKNTFVMSHNSKIMYSSDAKTWTSATPTVSGITKVAYGGGRFMAVGASKAYTSTDGITWTATTGVPANNWLGLSYGVNNFVAVSSNGTGNRVMSIGCTY